MRDRLKSTAGWLFVLAFLALPNCGLSDGPFHFPEPNFSPGPEPNSSIIFCDIEDIEISPHCATDEDLANGRALAHAAIDLLHDNNSPDNVGLDFRDAAIAAQHCSPGRPVAIKFIGPFPRGTEACLNCGTQIGLDATYPDVRAACIALCNDIVGDDTFCSTNAHAKASTNAGSCFDGACTEEGSPLDPPFDDPRQHPEPVNWLGPQVGNEVTANGGDLTRNAPTASPFPGLFDAGAFSDQIISKGTDGYLEFKAVDDGTARVCGLSSGESDTNDTDLDIDFGIRLTAGGHILISEKGTLVVPPDGNPNFWFGDYQDGDYVRVTVTANPDGTTANIAYFLVPGSCVDSGCPGKQLRPFLGDSTTPAGPPITAPYPFRIDASLREKGATLTDVRVVRIKQ